MTVLDHNDPTDATDPTDTTEELFCEALWAHDLMEWAARLEMAVTHGYDLASIERSIDPAGEILLDQLSGLPCSTGADVRARWPNLSGVFFREDEVFVEVVFFVLDRAATLRDTAYDMATIAHLDRGAA